MNTSRAKRREAPLNAGPMNLQELCNLIQADQFRYDGKVGWRDFFRQWWMETGFRYSVAMRLTAFFRAQKWSRYGIYHLCLWRFRRMQVRHSTFIDFSVSIGGGLYLGHLLCIVVNSKCVIGRNCTLSHGVTLGQANSRSKHPGNPVLGNRVYLGPGCKVVGGIHIGDDVAIGPNSVVVKDVRPQSVVSGIPAVEISTKGSAGYVSNQAG
jgi:serine O-acetyltransferase